MLGRLRHGRLCNMTGQPACVQHSELWLHAGFSDVPASAIAEMKEKLCFVPLDYDKEIAAAETDPATYTLPVSTSLPHHLSSDLSSDEPGHCHAHWYPSQTSDMPHRCHAICHPPPMPCNAIPHRCHAMPSQTKPCHAMPSHAMASHPPISS